MASRHSGQTATSTVSESCSQSGGEDFLSQEITKKEIIEYLYLVTLLSQFNIASIRTDFEDGKFNLPHEFNISLQELDTLRFLIVPPWGSTGPVEGQLRVSLSALQSVIARVREVPSIAIVCATVPARSFKNWSPILRRIALSPYWETCKSSANPATSQPLKSVATTLTETDPVLMQDASTESSEEPVLLKEELSTAKRIGMVTVTGATSTDEHPNKQQRGPHQVYISRGRDKKLQSSDNHCSLATPKNSAESFGPLTCDWCKRRGHPESTCYRKLGLCLICGGKHGMRHCSKFVQPQKLFTLNCPLCAGSHLGKHCPLNRIQKCCSWCGKSGHLESNCWHRMGNCFICGDHSHHLEACTRFVPQKWQQSQVITFPPWCVDCGTQHLGADCGSPYQE